MQRLLKTLCLVAVTGALAACAGMRSVNVDVNSYSQWPAERKPATYAFERLPSQQANAQQQATLEEAARGALAEAGFTEVSEATKADTTVQISWRTVRQDVRSPWDDPFWHWGLGFGWPHGRSGVGVGMGWNMGAPPSYGREVAVLIRDRKTGQPLYESRGSNEGNTTGDATTLAAMFEATLKDFPQPAVNPRRVTVPLAQ